MESNLLRSSKWRGGGTLEITTFGEFNQVNVGYHLIVIDRPTRFRGYHVNARLISITEAGVHSRFLGMTDDKTNYGVGSRDANYFLNYEVVGQARLAYLDKLRELDVDRVIHFTVPDTFTDYTTGAGNWKEIYGEIRGDIQIDVLPTLARRTYLSGLAWATRSGLPGTSRDPMVSNNEKGSFWNKGVRYGDYEQP